IKNNRVYKVTVSANTPGCGAVSKASFFKIVDGGAAGQFWRQVSPEGHELMGQGEINVYPNPSTGLFTIYFGKAVENATVIIQSMDGRIISNQTVSDEKIELNITNAPAGLYLIKIIDGAHTSIQKLVKQ
ncbi:MAG: T9SS type A sorting domain-containing protein, partial [Sphingobacteriales bacterium]